MLILAITLMAIGSFGVGGAVVMEMRTNEPIWMVMMKIFPWVFGTGAVILAVTLA